MIATGDMKIQIQKTTDKWIIINFQPLVKWYEWLIKCISALNKNKEADEKKNNQTKKIFTWKLESWSQKSINNAYVAQHQREIFWFGYSLQLTPFNQGIFWGDILFIFSF